MEKTTKVENVEVEEVEEVERVGNVDEIGMATKRMESSVQPHCFAWTLNFLKH